MCGVCSFCTMFQVYSNLHLFYNNIRIILEVHLSFKFKLEKEKLAIQTEETMSEGHLTLSLCNQKKTTTTKPSELEDYCPLCEKNKQINN